MSPLPPRLPLAQVSSEPQPLQPPSPAPDSGGFVGGSLTTLLVTAGLLLFLVKQTLRICNPNEILIVSGRRHRRADGQTVGYRVIFGGRTIAIPVLETVKRMDVTTMPVPIEVRNAYARGGTPLHIQAIANVKVTTDPGRVGNAIERFLDRNRGEVVRVARETLEGNLRGVVATLTPEQVNEDRLQFAERIAQDVDHDLAKLGLHLDTLKIQSVADDVDYLKSIGRQRIAQIVRDAEIAEAEALGQAERREADAQQQAEVAKTQAATAIQQKQNELRTIKAQLEQQSRSEEERTNAAALEARARAEQELQTVRAELERYRLEADEVLPAQAQQRARELQAKGAAAIAAENAKAAALVNEMLTRVWREAGSDAGQVFLLQQVEMVLREAARLPEQLDLQRISVVDSGDGQALARLITVYPAVVRQFLEQVHQTLGIDVIGTLNPEQR